MTSDDLAKLFWVLKKVTDDEGHYLSPFRRGAMHHALAAVLELADKKRIVEEAKHFRTCHECKEQIDIRSPVYRFDKDGNIVHMRCPELKSDVERDI